MFNLLKDLKWSPDGCIVETISAGSYQDGELPARALTIAEQLGIIEIVASGDDQTNAGKQPEQPEAKKSKK
ncbi:hypothetical protein [Pectobacterium brasiliense]|uniref:hypothetical protein n=1 Tax=Pectobacterium brasiliense TaxID=180957 RepID=UPI0025A1912F|nr:hypothetical protein [Pectobacterium brasiliense]WJM83219.1 hypothetical protein QTI90_10950 [Pectobacterium brasiliense]